MRILFIYDNHDGFGGAENYCRTLQNKINDMPHLKKYCIAFGAEETENENELILKKNKLKITRWFWQIFSRKSVINKISQKILSWQPDVIHLHNIKQDTASVLSAIKNHPTLMTMHDYSYICPLSHNTHHYASSCETGWRVTCGLKHRVKYSIVTYCLMLWSFLVNLARLKKHITCFTAPSPLLRDYLLKNNFNHVRYIPPFIEKPAPFSWQDEKESYFLFAGNVNTHKGIYFLLDEFMLALKSNRSIKLWIIGNGPDWQKINELIQKNKLEKNICLLNWQRDLTVYYEKATAVIFPSMTHESFGLMMTEAMSFGRPVIACNRSTAPWLIAHQENGLLYPPLEKGALANHILLLANNPALTKKLGKNAHEKMLTAFDNGDTLNQFINCYQQCIALHQNRKLLVS